MIIVQKYGGTSVGSLENIQKIAKKIAKNKNKLVVVVSAMAGVTNELIKNANELNDSPDGREMDLLLSSGERISSAYMALALKNLGIKAKSFSGPAAGIYTDTIHTKAKIKHIDTRPLLEALKNGYVCIVAGFQGLGEHGDVTTLGRGGSDLSAVALAGALKAKCCEIYTDVDGIYTTDPRIEPKAKKLDIISYEEMLELAALGAKVLQNRSVELAKKLDIKLVTKNTFSDDKGTLITKEGALEEALVSGIALDKNQARLSLRDIDDNASLSASIFEALNLANINVDVIVQNMSHEGKTNLGFTVPQDDLKKAIKSIKALLACEVETDEEIVKVSVVGIGMKSHAGVASKAFGALAKEGIKLQMISTSEIKISMIVEEKYAELAVRVLHEAYGLDK